MARKGRGGSSPPVRTQRKWWNWQTRWLQRPVARKGRGGSKPSFRTTPGWWNWQTRQSERLVARKGCGGSRPPPGTSAAVGRTMSHPLVSMVRHEQVDNRNRVSAASAALTVGVAPGPGTASALRPPPTAPSSIGRAPDYESGGWGFESLGAGNAGVAKQADAPDSKSGGPEGPGGFESLHPYHKQRIGVPPVGCLTPWLL